MTRKKSDLVRPFQPERVSRETMAYLLDVSTDTFDNLVATGRLPAPRTLAGIKRWDRDAVLRRWDGLDAVEPLGSSGAEPDAFMAGMGAFGGKAQGGRRPS